MNASSGFQLHCAAFGNIGAIFGKHVFRHRHIQRVQRLFPITLPANHGSKKKRFPRNGKVPCERTFRRFSEPDDSGGNGIRISGFNRCLGNFPYPRKSANFSIGLICQCAFQGKQIESGFPSRNHIQDDSAAGRSSEVNAVNSIEAA